jgi:phage protein D
MPPETPSLASARPLIEIQGQEESQLSAALISLLIVENVQGLYRCELRVANLGEADRAVNFLFLNRQKVDFGHNLKVKTVDGNTTIFDGRVMAFEADYPEGEQPQITFLAEDRLQDLRMTRRTRSFDEISDADLFQRIAQDHNLTADVNITGPTHRLLTQVNQSDLAFLRERARLIEAELWLDGSTLHASSRADRSGDNLPLSYNGTLRSFTVLADLSPQRTAIKVTGWDVGGKQAIEHEADEAAIRSETGSNKSGAALLQEKLGERKDMLAHTVPLTLEEARSYAEGVFRSRARRFVSGRGITEFDAKLRVGNSVELRGLGEMFSGKYALVEVRHLFDMRHGFRTEFAVERAFITE